MGVVPEAADALAVGAEFGAQEAGERGDEPAGQFVELGGGLCGDVVGGGGSALHGGCGGRS